jgi:hypothetical protein
LKEQGVFVLAHHRVFLPCLQKGMVGGRDAREQLCRLSLPAFNVLACTGTRNTRVFYLSLSLSLVVMAFPAVSWAASYAARFPAGGLTLVF